MRRGHRFPHPLVTRTPRGDRWQLLDGTHRLAAAVANGATEVDCRLVGNNLRL